MKDNKTTAMTDALDMSNIAIAAINRKIDSLRKAGTLTPTEANALLKNLSKVKRGVCFTQLWIEEERAKS